MSSPEGAGQARLAALTRTRGLPIAVAAGLACGVFSGLLIVHRAHASGERMTAQTAKGRPASPTTAARHKVAAGTASGAAAHAASAPADAGRAAVAASAGKTASGSHAAAASTTVDAAPKTHPKTGSGSETASSGGTASHSAAPATATLRFEVLPTGVDGTAITVDGKPLSGNVCTVQLDGGKKRVKVVARAHGYLTWSHHVTVRHDKTVRIHLRHPKPSSAGPGGLIHL